MDRLNGRFISLLFCLGLGESVKAVVEIEVKSTLLADDSYR